MNTIPTDPISRDFAMCWQSAGFHLEAMGQKNSDVLKPELLMLPPGQENSACIWLKAELRPPFLEHLSFRFGNQLFFIRIEDIDGKLDFPGSRAGLQRIADACEGFACILPMRKKGEQWIPVFPNWGLVALPNKKTLSRLRTNQDEGWGLLVINDPTDSDTKAVPVDPVKLVSAEKIEMTDWELQDLAVQIVRNSLPHDKLMSWNSDPDVMPSLWFVGDYGPEWVIIKAVRYPATDAELPDDIARIAENCSKLSRRGNFAVVSVASDEPSKLQGKPEPLYRGHLVDVNYQGMRKINF